MITASGGDTAYARWSCSGKPGQCKGKFDLTGGTGEFKGAKGSSVLKAPFSGRVAQRYVENFTEVQAKERVMAIQDVETLEIKLNVPENVIRMVRRDDGSRDRVPVDLRFEGGGDQSFPLTFKEAATRADAQTQTFEVTFTLPAPSEVNLLPGMTVSVDVDLSKIANAEKIISLPNGAVAGDVKKSPTV